MSHLRVLINKVDHLFRREPFRVDAKGLKKQFAFFASALTKETIINIAQIVGMFYELMHRYAVSNFSILYLVGKLLCQSGLIIRFKIWNRVKNARLAPRI